MTDSVIAQGRGSPSREEIDLIRHTVAVGATDSELKLFLYQATKRGLDPLARQIHFIKRKRYNPETERYEEVGTIQTGIDGFRVVADRTGKRSGISRGAIRNDKGELTGAWAEVYRSDWQHPAREEVSLKEYCQKKKDGSPMGLWATMPETMIKKVAESAALRMAFPEDLSGIYTHDEMQQADIEILPLEEHKEAIQPEAISKMPGQPETTPEALEQPLQPSKEKIGTEAPIIDLDWLKESMGRIKWREAGVVAWIRSKANYQGMSMSGRFGDIIRRMNKEQAEFLVKEINSRLEMV